MLESKEAQIEQLRERTEKKYIIIYLLVYTDVKCSELEIVKKHYKK